MSALDVKNAVNLANTNAKGFVDSAKEALLKTESTLEEMNYAGITYQDIVPATLNFNKSLPAAPVLSISPINIGAVPTDSSRYEGIPSAPGTSFGSAPSNAPTVRLPSRPANPGNVPTAPSFNSSFAIPTPPALLSAALPSTPTISDVVVPSAPDLAIPKFDFQNQRPLATIADLDEATVRNAMDASFNEKSLDMQRNADEYVRQWIDTHNPEYHSQLAAIEAQLSKYLQGGTGLSEEIETKIYDRARAKNDLETKRVQDAIVADAAAKGFSLPTGAVFSAMNRARQEAATNNSKTSSEIAIAQAEMEQKNLQFAVTTSAGIRASMVSAASAYMGHVINIQGQAMKYAEMTYQTIVGVYNASVQVFSARMEQYRIYAAIYDAEIKGVLAEADLYRTEIAGLESAVNVDRAKIDAFKAVIDASTAAANMYRAQVDAVLGQANMEKLKIDMFQAQVQAYGANVQALNAQWGGYSAEIQGNKAEFEAFSARVEAFGAEVKAKQAQVEAYAVTAKAIGDTNIAKATVYQSQLGAFRAQVDASKAVIEAETVQNKGQLDGYMAALAGFEAAAKIEIAKFSADADAKAKNAAGNLTAQVETSRALTQYGINFARLSTDGAQIYGQLASSAMSGLNTLSAQIANS